VTPQLARVHALLLTVLVICGGAYMLLLYLDTRKRPESLLNGPTNRSWVERRLDSVTRYLGPFIAILAVIVSVPAIVAEDIALLKDPWDMGPGAIARAILTVLRLIF
jgi:hypothetical protein